MARKSSTEARKAKALDAALRGMFGNLEKRVVPDEVRTLIEQLHEADRASPHKPTGR